jgi:hypothetical protein
MMRALVLLILMTSAALAHSWYPLECCSERDCYPVPVAKVKAVSGGWLVEGSTFVRHQDARPSPDGQFHICRHQDGKGAMIAIPGRAACFWAPIEGS